jgi:predicted nuclease of predicted toxin-antitoxin system
MRVKLDENLPHELARLLREHGHHADTVMSEGLTGRADVVVWQATQAAQRFLITTDLDFSDVRRFRPGTHAGVLLIRLHEEGRDRLLAYMRELLTQHDFANWRGMLVVATDRKVRVRSK